MSAGVLARPKGTTKETESAGMWSDDLRQKGERSVEPMHEKNTSDVRAAKLTGGDTRRRPARLVRVGVLARPEILPRVGPRRPGQVHDPRHRPEVGTGAVVCVGVGLALEDGAGDLDEGAVAVPWGVLVGVRLGADEELGGQIFDV